MSVEIDGVTHLRSSQPDTRTRCGVFYWRSFWESCFRSYRPRGNRTSSAPDCLECLAAEDNA